MKKSTAALFKHSYNFKAITATLFTQKGFKSFDGLRAIFMTWIIVFHCAFMTIAFSPASKTYIDRLMLLDEIKWYEYWITNAHYGLDMFFILSGFLIAFLLFSEWDKTKTLNLKRFYYRRFMRLMPVYLFLIILAFAALSIMGMPNRWHLITNIFYINNFFNHNSNPIPWTWSLAVEEQFYFLLPIFILLMKNKNLLIWFLFLFILSFIIRYLVIINNESILHNQIYTFLIDKKINNDFQSALYDNLYTRYGAFICGISAAYLFKYHKTQISYFFKSTFIGKLASIICIACVFYLLFAHNIFTSRIEMSEFWRSIYLSANRNIFSLAMAITIILLLIESPLVKPINRILQVKIWIPIAQITYSAYIIHFIIVFAVAGFFHEIFAMQYADGKYLFVTSVISIVLTYLCSALLYYCIEAPFMRWRDALSGESLREEVQRDS